MKNVYLVRHAESEQNVKSHALVTSLNDIMKLKMPSNLSTGLSWFDLRRASTDSPISETGKVQIQDVAADVSKDNFLVKHNIQLIVHSPLLRAKQTCLGIFGCVHNNSEDSEAIIDFETEAPTCNIPVIELDSVMEKQPAEWLPGQIAKLEGRIEDFEQFLNNRPEENIVVVGHSQYFKKLLSTKYKFQNCDVWKTKFAMDTKLKEVQINEEGNHCFGRWELEKRLFSTSKATETNMEYFSTL